MEYIRVTKENLEKEHICCAISNNNDVQVSSKKAWLADRFVQSESSRRFRASCAMPKASSSRVRCARSLRTRCARVPHVQLCVSSADSVGAPALQGRSLDDRTRRRLIR